MSLAFGVHRAPALLRRYTKRLGITQKELARRLGITQAAVSHALNGKHAPDPERAEIWCQALELTGAEAERLTDAIHLASATPRVRAMVRGMKRR